MVLYVWPCCSPGETLQSATCHQWFTSILPFWLDCWETKTLEQVTKAVEIDQVSSAQIREHLYFKECTAYTSPVTYLVMTLVSFGRFEGYWAFWKALGQRNTAIAIHLWIHRTSAAARLYIGMHISVLWASKVYFNPFRARSA